MALGEKGNNNLKVDIIHEYKKLVIENANLKRQLKKQHFQLQVPLECISFDDTVENEKFKNVPKEKLNEYFSYIQHELNKKKLMCIIK